jgi:hypothetical protein
VLAEIAERQPVRRLVDDEARRPLRQQDLAAVGGAHDARRSVHVQTRVQVVCHHRLACMEADAHADRLCRPPVADQRPLPGRRRCDRLADRLKGEKETVPLHLHLHPAALREGLPQQRTVHGQCLHVPLPPELLQQARRPLDVGEQQGHRPARKLSHRRA